MGPASSANVSTAVITFARSACGVRIVITPISGAFTSGPNSDETKSTATTPQAGRWSASSGIGRTRPTSAHAARRIGSNRGTSFTATTLPTTAPAPNAAKKTPATHLLVVRHRDRPGVLAHVFDRLRSGQINVQETENIIFEGAEAAVARINLDGAPSDTLLHAMQDGNADILDLHLVTI